MNNRQRNLYVIIKESDFEKVDLRNNDSFALCKRENKNYKTFTKFPDPIKTYQNSDKQVLIGHKIFENIIKIVNKSLIKEDKKIINELLKPYIDLKISIYLYLTKCIPNYKFYKLYTSGRWKKYDSKSNLIIGIEKEYMKEKIGFFNKNRKSIFNEFNFFHKFLASLQVFLLKKILKRKNLYILSCKKSYFMPKIYEKLREMDRNIIIYNQSKKLSKISLIIIKQMYTLISKNKIVDNDFFMIPENHFKKTKILNIKSQHDNSLIDKEYLSKILEDIEYYINLNKGYRIYNKKLFKNYLNKNSNTIFHTNRFPELNALSATMSDLGFKQHLISHGTHTLQKDSLIGNIISDNLSIGMIRSNIPNIKIYSQSKFSDDYLAYKNVDFKKIKPLNKINKIQNRFKDSSVLNILSAGTVKRLGARRHYFESSFEYIYGIIELVKKLKNLDFNFKLTIRIREVKHELDMEVIKEIKNQFKDLIEISKNKSIADDIKNSDCLIALSSTTLEEAINCKTPSMSYGFSNYNHFKFYDKNKYRINSKLRNFNKLKKIEDLLGRNFVYLEDKFLIREKSLFDYI